MYGCKSSDGGLISAKKCLLSCKREAALRDVQMILDDSVLKVKEIHAVRGLSYFNALTTVWRCLESLLVYFRDCDASKDYKAAGIRYKIANEKFVSITYMMMDAMGPVTTLSQYFQKENLDIAQVKVKIDLCSRDLRQLRR